jgi:hypothetical protein
MRQNISLTNAMQLELKTKHKAQAFCILPRRWLTMQPQEIFCLFLFKNNPAILIANSLQMIVEYLLLPCNFECPAITMANHAKYSLQLIVESLFLLCDEDNSEIMASSLLLFCVKDAPAIMMATHADYSLQLIVESLFTGAKQVVSATIPNKSFKLIDVSKTSLHFRKDCGMFYEGEWEQKRRFSGHTGIIDISFNGVSGIIGQIRLSLLIGLCIGLNGHIRHNGLINHMGLAGHTDIASASIISLVGRIVDRNGLIGLISLINFGVISFVGLICLISLVGLSLNGLIGQIGFIGLGISNLGMISLVSSSALFARQLIGFIGLSIICLISLIRLNGHISLVDLGRTSLTSIVGLIGLIGRIGLNSHNDGVGLVNNIEFETPCYSLVREGWLWCVRRLCSLARLDSDFFFRHALQYAKQLFYSRIPQMTKYFVMRECEDSYTESLCCDSAFAHKKKFYIFKFPKRFSEIS